jgi:hypothetical protein
MKRFYLIFIFLTFSLFAFSKEYKVYGPQGGLAMEVTLPDDFNEDTDKCPMVILMHGIFSSKNIVPIPALAMIFLIFHFLLFREISSCSNVMSAAE